MTPCVFYFGCIGGLGHYWWSAGGMSISKAHGGWHGPHQCPWKHVDGSLAPRCGRRDRHGVPSDEASQGVASIHHVDGWTALSFWDRSVDHRGASSSTFVTHDTVGFNEMVKRAQAAFPLVWARFPFSVVPVPAPTTPKTEETEP